MHTAEHVFLNHLQSLQRHDTFNHFREKSWHRLLELGLPHRSHEAFRYVHLKELYQTSFGFYHPKTADKSSFIDAILPECRHSHLVFVDGQFSLELSDISALPPQTILLPLDEAFRSHASFLNPHISHSLKEEKDPFALINLALHSKGLFFYLPPKLEIKSPVQTLYLFTTREPIVALPRLYLTVGAQGRLNWIATAHHFHPNLSHFVLPHTEIFLEEGSTLNWLNAIDSAQTSQTSQTSWIFESVRADVKKSARFHTLNFTFGAKAVRQSYRINLKGENSEADLNGLWMLSKNRTAHTHAIIEHEAPHTRSMQRFKGVLQESSQSSFEGKILVRPEAQKTEAYQINNNLIIGQNAIANSKPNLEIFADDVKASHGATVSQLDQEQLFYLTTRGIDPNHARSLLIDSFCREMINRIPCDSFLQKMLRAIETFVTSGAS